MTNQSPKISVIVPVYNVEQYLPRCIDSILTQTFTDFELLLIDDGSKDNSGKICDEYAARDGRVMVIHKENGGVSSARNIGLDRAKGQWVCFCDSDDWVDEDFLGTFYNMQNDGDMLSQGFHAYGWHYTGDCDVFQPTDVYTGEVLFPFVLDMYATGQLGYLWCKSFRRDIILSCRIRFDETIHLMEDLVFVLQYCGNIASINNTSACHYHYKFTEQGKKFKKQDNFIVYKKIYFLINALDENGRYDQKLRSWFGLRLLNILFYENVESSRLKKDINFFVDRFYNGVKYYDTSQKKIRLFKSLAVFESKVYANVLIRLFRLVTKSKRIRLSVSKRKLVFSNFKYNNSGCLKESDE